MLYPISVRKILRSITQIIRNLKTIVQLEHEIYVTNIYGTYVIATYIISGCQGRVLRHNFKLIVQRPEETLRLARAHILLHLQ